jgi:hypothetical protein
MHCATSPSGSQLDVAEGFVARTDDAAFAGLYLQ